MRIKSVKHCNDNYAIYYNQIVQKLFEELVYKNTGYGRDENDNVIITMIKTFYDIYLYDDEKELEEPPLFSDGKKDDSWGEPIFHYKGIWIEVKKIIEGEKEDSVELSIYGEENLSEKFEYKLKHYKKV
jgi:hypothetical protein